MGKIPMNSTCDVCEMHPATLYCDADEAYLCRDCDASVHGANTLASRHKRIPLEQDQTDNVEEQEEHGHLQFDDQDGVCPHSDPASFQFKASALDFPLGGIRVGDITYARVGNSGASMMSTAMMREEEDAHQVPRFVPVAQELPSLEPFRFHALATNSGSGPVHSTRFMKLLESGTAADDDAAAVDAPEAPVVVDSHERVSEEGVTTQEIQELGVVPEMAPVKGPRADKEREARVNRYREKRRTRMFSKKIRYEVRKIYAENRPRLKGRFVRRTNDMESLQCLWSEDK